MPGLMQSGSERRAENSVAEHAQLELRPYQFGALDGVRVAFDRGDRSTLVVCPTGTGKTVIFAELVREAVQQGIRVLVLAHRDELLKQARKKLEAVGVWADTEKGKSRASTLAKVVVASVQSLRGKRLERFSPAQFGLIIVDESHHATATSYRAVLDHFVEARVVGVTATPDRADGTALGEVFQSVAYRYELRQAIADEWLAPIVARRIVVDSVDLSTIHTRAGDLAQNELAEVMVDEEALRGVVVPLLDLAQDRRTIVFGVDVDHAHKLAALINAYRPGSARAVDGETDEATREQALVEFEVGQFQFLVNCALYTEGFDCPAVSCVAVVRPTKSRALYTQMVGRGTRLLGRSLDESRANGKHDCIAEGQRVLTDHGLVPIEKVTVAMRVWDGVEFVEHDGVVCRGEQDVVDYAGLVATADHRVWTDAGWETLGACAAEQAAIRVTGSGRTPVREAEGCVRRDRSREEPSAPSDDLHGMSAGVGEGVGQRDARNSGMSSMRPAASRSEVAMEPVLAGAAAMHESDERVVSGLWRTGDSVPVRDAARDGAPCVGDAGFASRAAARSHQERRPLRAGESAVLDEIAESAQPTSAQESKRAPVYDIVNAGPRHRFTVEGLLVSNCLVLDFTGQAGRHRLIGPVDCLAGNDELADDLRDEIDRLLGSAQYELEDVLQQADDEVSRRRAALAINAVVKYHAEQVDPFLGDDVLDDRQQRLSSVPAHWERERATPAQLSALEKLKVTKLPPEFTKADASKLLDWLARRRKAGLCTYGQARAIHKTGIDTRQLSFERANELILKLKANGWVPWSLRGEPEYDAAKSALDSITFRDEERVA